MTGPALKMRAKVFTASAFVGVEKRRMDTCGRAASFATSQGPDRVASITHAQSQGTCSVTVWYWASTEAPT